MNLLVNQPAAKAVATLVLAHGAGAPMDSDFMNSLVQALVERGFTVVRFEFPYMAQRREDGKKRPPNKASILIETFEQVIADVQTLPDVSKPLLIGGKSMGGRIASMLADNPAVDGVCCFGYPFHPPVSLKSWPNASLISLLLKHRYSFFRVLVTLLVNRRIWQASVCLQR